MIGTDKKMSETISLNYLDADLNDKRLTKRFNEIIKKLPNNVSGSVAEAMESKSATKGAYRFFRNKKVSHEKLLDAHLESLDILPCNGEQSYYLCLSDTTTLDYSTNRGSENLGYLTKKYARGIYLHNDLIISQLGIPKHRPIIKHIFIRPSHLKLVLGLVQFG